jgi:integrase
MIAKDWCRSLINKCVGRLKLVFRWGVENKIVPVRISGSGESNYLAMLAVKNLKAGRSKARESAPVKPVPLAIVDATIPFMSLTAAAMTQVQLLTGARPGEVCRMRGVDIDMTGAVWLYRPGSDQGPHGQHKNAWRGQKKIICIGPRAQAILRPFLKPDPQAFLFSPRESRAAFDALRKQNRKSPMTPSQAKRKPKENPKRQLGEFYTPAAYCKAIYQAVGKANRVNPAADLPRWHPHQLRHTRATELRRRYGTEAAQAVLGHESLDATELYAEADLGIATRIMAEIG